MVKETQIMSEEDLALKEKLELLVRRVQDTDTVLKKEALESLRHEIQNSTSSMTSVPKPLKYLRTHYENLKIHFKEMEDSDLKKLFADILSVLALTMSAEGKNESVRYRLLGSQDDIGSWGHAYVRNLAGEIVREVKAESGEDEDYIDEVLDLARHIVAFHMKNNAEYEAVDLLMEVDMDLDHLMEHLKKENCKRTCLYITSCAKYLLEDDNSRALDSAYTLCLKFKEYPTALQIALRLNNMEYVQQVFTSCDDLLSKKQFCFIIGRHGITFEFKDRIFPDEEERDSLEEIIQNSKLSEGYLVLARDIDVMGPKTPEDIYKAHQINMRAHVAANLNSARQNLAATFVNAFVNAGFCQDKLMTVTSESSSNENHPHWLFRNKEDGKISAVASLGLIFLWDVDDGLAQLDKYYESDDTFTVAGACLGIGIVNCNTKNKADPAFSLLVPYCIKEDPSIIIGAVMGLGLAYVGQQNDPVVLKLSNTLLLSGASLDVKAFTAISMGLIFVGSGKHDVARLITLAFSYLSNYEMGKPLARLMVLGIGLIYLGKQDFVDDILNRIGGKIREYCDTTLQSFAYAGTGDVHEVQYFLAQCGEQLKNGETYQAQAVLGIAMVAMADELDQDMAIRSLEHLLQYGEPNIRRVVPLALGLLCISNPKIHVMDRLKRLSHDSDIEVVMSAIVALGLIGAGTNNARIAGILRNLSTSYYYRDPNVLFCVRIAQGLVHLGKGLLTLSPHHSEQFLLSPAGLSGLFIFLHACLDMNSIVLGKYHYVLYYLVLSIQPRMLLTVDENLQHLSVPVRVGKAVDVVGQVGQPRSITGFNTFSTPVLLGAGQRAELATEKYLPLSPFLDGCVILKENPDYREGE